MYEKVCRQFPGAKELSCLFLIPSDKHSWIWKQTDFDFSPPSHKSSLGFQEECGKCNNTDQSLSESEAMTLFTVPCWCCSAITSSARCPIYITTWFGSEYEVNVLVILISLLSKTSGAKIFPALYVSDPEREYYLETNTFSRENCSCSSKSC